MKWDGSNWQWVWGNAGNGRLQLRTMAAADAFVPGFSLIAPDAFVPGHFYGDGKDALFVGHVNLVNPAKRNAYLITGETVGTWQWMREDVGKMAYWYLNPDDRFVRGDFRGTGRDELLAIATSGWAHLMTLDK